MYVFNVEMTMDVPNEPGEHCAKSLIKRVLADDARTAISKAVASVPSEVVMQVKVPGTPYYSMTDGPTRPVRGVVVTNCSKVCMVEIK